MRGSSRSVEGRFVVREGLLVLLGVPDDWEARAIDEHRALVASGNMHAALGCAADALARLHRELGAPPSIDAWVRALDADIARGSLDDPDVERHILRAALAILARCPRHAALPLWHARALALLRRPDAPADDALVAAGFAFEYAVRAGNFLQAREIVALARMRSGDASETLRERWLEAEALEAWLAGDHARARAAVSQALALGGGYAAWEQGASAALREGDVATTDHCLDAMARTIDPRRSQDVAHSHFLQAARARIAGDDRNAQSEMAACLAVDVTNTPAYFTTLWQLGHAHLLVARGRHRPASGALGVVLASAATHYWSFLRFSALLSRTWLRLRQRRKDEAAVDLAVALALARDGAYASCDPWWDREAMCEIGAFARTIEHDAETLRSLLATHTA